MSGLVNILNAGLASKPLIGNPLLTPFLTLLLGKTVLRSMKNYVGTFLQSY